MRNWVHSSKPKPPEPTRVEHPRSVISEINPRSDHHRFGKAEEIWHYLFDYQNNETIKKSAMSIEEAKHRNNVLRASKLEWRRVI